MLPKLSWSTEVGLKAYDQGWDFRQGQPEHYIPALLFKVGWNFSIQEVIKLPNRELNQPKS